MKHTEKWETVINEFIRGPGMMFTKQDNWKEILPLLLIFGGGGYLYRSSYFAQVIAIYNIGKRTDFLC
jgi:hypothetical protein